MKVIQVTFGLLVIFDTTRSEMPFQISNPFTNWNLTSTFDTHLGDWSEMPFQISNPLTNWNLNSTFDFFNFTIDTHLGDWSNWGSDNGAGDDHFWKEDDYYGGFWHGDWADSSNWDDSMDDDDVDWKDNFFGGFSPPPIWGGDWEDQFAHGTVEVVAHPEEIITCKTENVDDYLASGSNNNITLAEPSFLNCEKSLEKTFKKGYSFPDDYGGDPYETLMTSVLEDPKCAMLGHLEGVLSSDSNASDSDFMGIKTDFTNLDFMGIKTDFTNDFFQDMCSEASNWMPCVMDVFLPKYIEFLNNDEYDGCCVGVDQTDEGQQFISMFINYVETIESILCDIRQPLDGEEPQTCGFTLMEGIVGYDVFDTITNIFPWLQIPTDQACLAFAGKPFSNTKGETSSLFPSSPLRNCAIGHEKLFSAIQSIFSQAHDDMFEGLPVQDMFTAGNCLNIAHVFQSILGGGRRSLQLAGQRNTLMNRMLQVVGGTRGRILQRHLDMFMTYMSIMEEVSDLCIHLPTNFSASCDSIGS